jgi:hypothetical protein
MNFLILNLIVIPLSFLLQMLNHKMYEVLLHLLHQLSFLHLKKQVYHLLLHLLKLGSQRKNLH